MAMTALQFDKLQTQEQFQCSKTGLFMFQGYKIRRLQESGQAKVYLYTSFYAQGNTVSFA